MKNEKAYIQVLQMYIVLAIRKKREDIELKKKKKS